MTTGENLNIDDKVLIDNKQSMRTQNHHSSAKYKSRNKEKVEVPNVHKGQLVYLYGDRSKLQGRDKYIIVEVMGEDVKVQKFTKYQFRQRIYKVKISDLIIIPEVPDPPISKKQASSYSPTCSPSQLPKSMVPSIQPKNQPVFVPPKSFSLPKVINPCQEESSDSSFESDEFIDFPSLVIFNQNENVGRNNENQPPNLVNEDSDSSQDSSDFVEAPDNEIINEQPPNQDEQPQHTHDPVNEAGGASPEANAATWIPNVQFPRRRPPFVVTSKRSKNKQRLPIEEQSNEDEVVNPQNDGEMEIQSVRRSNRTRNSPDRYRLDTM